MISQIAPQAPKTDLLPGSVLYSDETEDVNHDLLLCEQHGLFSTIDCCFLLTGIAQKQRNTLKHHDSYQWPGVKKQNKTKNRKAIISQLLKAANKCQSFISREVSSLVCY